MVPKLHAKGSSFKGAAAYLLHDKGRAASAERVAWVETRNLATQEPDIAWRVMASTAMDQDRLKAQAGVKNTGRKSDQHVLHFTLSWHPEQNPDRAEMLRAADGALKALGADKHHQALIIAHNDEQHAHLHVLLNRVSPQDGRQLSSSKEKLHLSRWAQAYEQETGVYCQKRIVNNAMRENDVYVRGDKDEARNIYEAYAERAASNDNSAQAGDVRAQQRAKDALLAARGRRLAELPERAWRRLAGAHERRKATLERLAAEKTEQIKKDTDARMQPAWRELMEHQAKEARTFEALESSFFGRASNMAKTIRASIQDVEDGSTGLLKRSFAILSNAGQRRAYFDAAQERQRTALHRQAAEALREGCQPVRQELDAKLQEAREALLQQRAALDQAIAERRKALQQSWKQRTAERHHAFAALAQEHIQTPYNRAAQDSARADGSSGSEAPSPAPTGPGKALQEWRAAVAPGRSRVDEFKDAMRRKTREQDNDRDR